MLRLIAAVDQRLGVADDRGIPWQGRIPSDVAYFRAATAEGIIVMGYRTYHEFTGPLHDRENFVVTRPETGALRPGFVGIDDPLTFLREHTRDVVWVIGGAALFRASLPLADQLYLTRLEADFHCTKFFPEFTDSFHLTRDLGSHRENDLSFRFEIWQRSSAPPS